MAASVSRVDNLGFVLLSSQLQADLERGNACLFLLQDVNLINLVNSGLLVDLMGRAICVAVVNGFQVLH